MSLRPTPSAVTDPAVAATGRGAAAMPRAANIFGLPPGLILTAGIASLAWEIGRLLPLLGAPVCGIALGVATRNLFGLRPLLLPGVRFAAQNTLQWSIVLLGFGLSLTSVVHTGAASLVITAVTVTTAFVVAWALGRALGIANDLLVLIGVGTAICGGSAIAAVSPVINADEHDTAFAISTIFLFNLIAVVLFPVLGHYLNLSDHGFGMWSGTAVNDTSSVVAVAYSWSHAAGDFATIVKLTRSTLILPVCVVAAIIHSLRHRRNGVNASLRRIFPWFILGFLAASALRSMGYVPNGWSHGIATLAAFLMVAALSAVGLSSDLRRIAATGVRPILLGTGVWAAVAASSLLAQGWVGQR